MEMKKHAIIFFLLLIVGANLFSYFGRDYVKANEFVVIPDEAIRLRILANSDSEADQALKRLVRDRVNEQITEWVKDLRSIEEGRQVMKDSVEKIKGIVANTLQEEGSKQAFTVQYDENIAFPTKMYGNFVYPAGNYEAILITLGEAEGANWWCVLFPPLCFLDFSNGEAVLSVEASEVAEEERNLEEELPIEKEAIIRDEEPERVEVRFFLKDLFESIFY
jgi:stage II sporulation protein R